MIDHDFKDVFAKLQQLPRVISEINQAGVDGMAPAVKQAMEETAAHGDVTGASRGSYRALTATNASTEAASGYAAAESALLNGPTNYGHAVSQSTGITQGEGEAIMVLTDYTSYGEERETAEAGKRAVEGPTLLSWHQQITRFVAFLSQRRLK